MNRKWLAATATAALIVLSLMSRAEAQAPAQAPPGGARAGAPAGQRGRGGPGDPFAGQPRIKALIVSGGCCHDYSGEAKVLMDSVSKVSVRCAQWGKRMSFIRSAPRWTAAVLSSNVTAMLSFSVPTSR